MIYYKLLLCSLYLASPITTARSYNEQSRQYSRSILPIHLIGGVSKNAGLLGVLDNGNWKYVCGAFWDNRNTKVVCRELGFTKVVYENMKNRTFNVHGIDFKPFHEYAITCEGNERSLSQCQQEVIKLSVLEQECNVNRRVYVECSNKKENDLILIDNHYLKYAIRLQSSLKQGDSISFGKLQIRSNGKWYDVCMNRWSTLNSNVACRQLGYPYSHKHATGAMANTKTFIPNVVNCTGRELLLSQCFLHQDTFDVCESNQTVILYCSSLNVKHQIEEKNNILRLRGGFTEGSGRVEIFDGKEWGTVCDDGWDLTDADVVCKQLGFGSAYRATHWADDGEGLGKIVSTNLRCHGNETDIRNCQSDTNGANTCTHEEDAGVKCFAPQRIKKELKLVGGDNMSGRLEVFFNKRWFGICGIGFTQREGAVACRNLGLGYNYWAGRSYKYGINDQKMMYNIKCNGTEKSLFQCQYQTHGQCRYYDMASVVCTKYAPDLVMDITTFKESIKVESHTLYELKCSYEERCLAPIVDTFYDSDRRRKRNLLKFTSRFLNKGAVSFRPHTTKSEWIYHKCHDHYHSMETFAKYDVIDQKGTLVADGQKASFCLEDSECEPGYKKVYNCSSKGDQGISVNCADNYKNTIDCQWVDITELPDGNYSLRVHVNPFLNVAESDYSNNRAVCEFHYYDGEVDIKGCTTDPCYQESFGGNSYGHCCHFPFKYQNQHYYNCIPNKEDGGNLWCATTVDYDKDGKWGFCEERM